ncbi:hypothetical protein [Streptacidiphilus neutrinimicus]|uniref:hypothetical protein n=1 Tax=Streptacidiphilus neutrinimicus TaxID=105420 RepID=UPI0005A89508|nr:hypothetical protein [Streptacidiphilus neutrinimicus]
MKLPPFGGRGLRGRLGPVVAAAGALLCVLGWYGVSGEQYAERQLPYLASATIPGAALIVAGAVLLARPDEERERERAAGDEETRRQLRLLYELLVEEAGRTSGGTPRGPAGEPAAVAAGRFCFLPNGRTYHRTTCLLVEGRGDALPVTPAGAQERGLRPCPLCTPAEPAEPREAAGPGPDAPPAAGA